MFGLVMIVSNEKVLRRALNSVKHITDQYLIQFDTEGDPGIDIVKEILGESKGETIVVPWRNHGYNRSIMFLQARARLTTKYIFWLDAKEVLVQPDYSPINKEKLLDELKYGNIFMAKTHYGDTHYDRWQIVLNDQLYYWQYPVHEQLKATRYERRVNIKSVVNYVRIDGASGMSNEKYLKYAKLCTDNVGIAGNELHCTYYAAQCFKDAGDNENAILWYKKYLESWSMTGYGYTSYCTLGYLTGDITYYNDAIKKFPNYALAYYNLARVYASREEYKLAVDTLRELKTKQLQPYVFEDMSIYDKIDSSIEEYSKKIE